MNADSRQLDEQFMRRAIRLAMKGRGYVEPNPMVGCVIVRDGRVIGEGYHEKYGEAHAERNALRAARECLEMLLTRLRSARHRRARSLRAWEVAWPATSRTIALADRRISP